MHEHRREVLRAASVALQGRAVTLWEVSSRAEVTPVMTSAASSQSPDTRLDLDSTLHRWGAPIIQGSRWVGCRLDDTGPWCVAPVRRQPAAPTPDGVERRSRERITLGLARSERLDAANVVRSCVALERPLALKRSVALQGVITVSGIFLQGDPNALYQVLTNLIRNAVSASRERNAPVVVTLGQVGEALRLTVQDHGVGIAGEHLERIFEPGFTTKEFGSGSGTGLTVVRQITQDMFAGAVKVDSAVGRGTTFEITLPIPVQRTPRGRRQA